MLSLKPAILRRFSIHTTRESEIDRDRERWFMIDVVPSFLHFFLLLHLPSLSRLYGAQIKWPVATLDTGNFIIMFYIAPKLAPPWRHPETPS